MDFQLGIIGGCMSSQAGIPFSKLYHRQLAAILDREDGIHLRVVIAREFESEYVDRLNSILCDTRLDGVLLHVRVTFQSKAALLARRDSDGKRQYFLHPYLFKRREFGWVQSDAARSRLVLKIAQRDIKPEDDGHRHGVHLGEPRIAVFRLRDVNWIIGSLIGLDDWAIEDELRMLARCQQTCIEAKIPLFVLGPTPTGISKWKYHLCQKMNRTLQSKLPEMGIPLCCFEPLLDPAGNRLINADGIHLTVDGHTYVANLLAEGMTPWIKTLVGQSTLYD